MSPVYKVNSLSRDNLITDIYVFAGLSKEKSKELTEAIRQTPAESATEYFDKSEIDYIISNNVNIEVVPYELYTDDTIDVVKRKILLATDTIFPFESIYLFGKVKKELSPITTYQTLTQNGRIELTRFRLLQFLLNIGYIPTENNNIQIKDVYTYDDIISLGLDKTEWNVSVPIGQRFVAVEGTYPYSVNPYNVDMFDKLLANSVSSMVTTTNGQLILDSGDLVGHNIFLCITPSVLETFSSKSLSEETGMRIYFPFLVSNQILTMDSYNENVTSLIKESKTLVSQTFVKQINSIELLNQIYKESESSAYSFMYEGVDSVEFIMHPQYSFNLPLDVVFKILHADESAPFLKYNPGKGQEKMYRLYANRTAVDGRKIPYLSKNEALKYAKVLAKKSSVSVLIQPSSSGNVFFCDFTDNGDILIKAQCDQILPINEVDDLIRQHVNPVITVVSDFLSQSGYQFDIFEGLTNERIEMINVEYKIGFPIRKQMNISKKLGCFSSVFNLIKEEIGKPIQLQYKRVSDFSEMESQEAFMLNQMKRGVDEEDLIAAVMENFGMTEEKVRERLASLLSGIQVIRNAFQNKRFRIKNNPGFPVVISRNVTTNAFDVVVSEITGADYLPYIRIFIDSLIRISQDIDSTTVSKKKIASVCSGKSEDIAVVADIVAAPELPIHEHSEIEIVAEEVEFHDIAQQEEYLDFLLGEDEDEDENKNEGEEDVSNKSSQQGGVRRDVATAVNVKGRGDDNDNEEEQNESEDNYDSEQLEAGVIRDVAGMSLGHPNPFFKRMKKRDPALFITRKEGKFNAYSKICPWSARRQPVVLTQEEKDNIDKNHPGSYQHAVKYGTNPKNPLWYICPRYWSLSRNTSLTEEQVKSGKFGKLISNPDAKVIPEGEDIFEFGHYDSAGNYEQFYPGFNEPSSHPDGFCLPCCFKKWTSPKQKQLREQCENQGMEMERKTEKVIEEKDKRKVGKKADQKQAESPDELYDEKEQQVKPDKDVVGRVEADNYIMGSDKFPLDQGRWGFLVPILQMFFQYDSKKCMVSPSNPTLKQDTPCLLRRGVEANRNQSFIAAIADAYAEENKNEILSVKSMKKQIISALTLSNFRLFQNGNLVEMFYDSVKNTGNGNDNGNDNGNGNDDTILDKYRNEPVYKELISQSNGITLLRKIANAFESFIDFLEDDNIVIDYTYLWDIICIPNQKLFKHGLNLIILETPNDDITGNIQLICPTNQYAKDQFDFNKSSLILFKSGKYYEPIYVMKDTGKTISLTRFFSLKSHTLLAPIKALLTMAKSATNEMCIPLASMPTVYNFRSNIPAIEAHRILMLRDINISKQIINFSGQTIAFIATVKNMTGYIPTNASSPLPSIPQLLIDDFDSYLNYSQTIAFLEAVSKITKTNIPCKPKLRLEEDGLTVGILTETNQLIMLREPELINDTMIPAIDENMTVANDIVSEISTDIDEERVNYVNKIRLDTEFYNSFRNTVRILLSNNDKRSIRMEIENNVRSPFLTYMQKLKLVSSLLKKLASDYIIWDDKFDMSHITDIKPTTCVILKKDKCETLPLCKGFDNICSTIIPSKNVLTNGNSEIRYYTKMADELIRYNRIRSFIFKPQSFLSFGKLNYDLGDNEILILQTMMTPEYFDSLETFANNRYVLNNAYQSTQPVESVPYSSVYIAKKEKHVVEKVEEDKPIEVVKLYGKWKSFFQTGTNEIKFSNSAPVQTFQPLLVLLQRYKPNLGNLSITDLKEMLVSQYEQRIPSIVQVKSIWSNEGKKSFAKLLKDEKATVDSIIMSEGYYITPIDIVLISNQVKLPLILYSSTKLSANNMALLKTEESTTYSFIKVPSLEMSDLPSYRIIVSKDGLQIPVLSLDKESREEIEATPIFNVTEYLKPYVIKVKRNAVFKLGDEILTPTNKAVSPIVEEYKEQKVMPVLNKRKNKSRLKIVA